MDWSLSGDSLSRPFGLDLGPPALGITPPGQEQGAPDPRRGPDVTRNPSRLSIIRPFNFLSLSIGVIIISALYFNLVVAEIILLLSSYLLLMSHSFIYNRMTGSASAGRYISADGATFGDHLLSDRRWRCFFIVFPHLSGESC